MNRIIILSVIFILVAIFISIIEAIDLPYGNDSVNGTIKSADQAIELAINIIGFQNIPSEKVTPINSTRAYIDITRDSVTPFISGEITGRKAWHIYFKDIVLNLSNTEYEQEEKYPKDIEIVIDSITGQLLIVKIVNSNVIDSINLYRDPTTQEATELLSSLGEKYQGLPSEPASITLLEALSECSFFPLLAKKIDIRYILYSFHNSEPVPAWTIYMRGLPPTSGINGIPEYKTTNRRTVINAISGKRLISNNLPYPNIIDDSLKIKDSLFDNTDKDYR